jgi:hypothetical protein
MDLKIQNIIERSNLKEFVSPSELAEVANYYLRENPKVSLSVICNLLNISPRTFSDKLSKAKIKKLSKKGLYIIPEELIENRIDSKISSNMILESQIEENQNGKIFKEKENPIKEDLSEESKDLGNENLKILINSIEKLNLTLEQINSKLINKNTCYFEKNEVNLELEEIPDDENHYRNIKRNKIPNLFTYLNRYVNETTSPLFMRRTFQYNPDAFEMFLKAYKKQGISQKEAVSQALFLYAYIYLTQDELESVELFSEVNYDSYSNGTSLDS